jgi:hypothetical protein
MVSGKLRAIIALFLRKTRRIFRPCILFPTAAVIAEFKDELKGFSPSKGTIHLPIEKALPAALIKNDDEGERQAGPKQSEKKQ